MLGSKAYVKGYKAGVRGATLLTHPIKNEETGECEEASRAYKKYMLLDNPSVWEQGYMDGFNSILEENRKKKS